MEITEDIKEKSRVRVIEVSMNEDGKKKLIKDVLGTSPIYVFNTSFYKSQGGKIIDLDCKGQHLNPNFLIGKWFTVLRDNKIAITSSKNGFKVYFMDKADKITVSDLKALKNFFTPGGFYYDVLTNKGGDSNMDYALNNIPSYNYYTKLNIQSAFTPLTPKQFNILNQFVKVLYAGTEVKKFNWNPNLENKDVNLDFTHFVEKYGGHDDYNMAIFNYGIYLGHRMKNLEEMIEKFQNDVRGVLSSYRVEKAIKSTSNSLRRYFG